jgi:hypothetical protein
MDFDLKKGEELFKKKFPEHYKYRLFLTKKGCGGSIATG